MGLDPGPFPPEKITLDKMAAEEKLKKGNPKPQKTIAEQAAALACSLDDTEGCELCSS